MFGTSKCVLIKTGLCPLFCFTSRPQELTEIYTTILRTFELSLNCFSVKNSLLSESVAVKSEV